jgi:hypothetical protein
LQRFLNLPWNYQAHGSRDLRLDLLRGYALLAIFINHCVFSQSLYYYISFQGIFYASAAHGFYFISGFVLGIISFDRPIEKVIKRIFRRTVSIYVAAVGLALGFLVVGYLTDLRLWYDLQLQLPDIPDLLPFIKGLLLLKVTYHGSEILVMYVWLMLMAFVVMVLIYKRLGWLVFLLSFAGYIYGQLFPQVYSLHYFNYFYLPSYQFVYICGIVLGYHRSYLADWEKQHAQFMRIVKMLVIAFFFILLLIFETHYEFLPSLPQLLGQTHFLPPVRLVLVIICLYSFYLLTTWFWKPLKFITGWLLLPLGQNSLWSFLAHYVVIVGFIYNFPGYQMYVDRIYGTLEHTLLLLLIWISIKVRKCLPKPGWRTLLVAGCLCLSLGAPFLQHWLYPYDYIDDRDSRWVWQEWESYDDFNAYQASLHGTDKQGAYGEITFSGTAVDFYATRNSGLGTLGVYLDGLYQGEIFMDNLDSNHYPEKVFSISGLTPSEHHLKLVSLANGWCTIDFIRVRR